MAVADEEDFDDLVFKGYEIMERLGEASAYLNKMALGAGAWIEEVKKKRGDGRDE